MCASVSLYDDKKLLAIARLRGHTPLSIGSLILVIFSTLGVLNP